MPWCEPCGRFYNPNTLSPEGRCPADHAVGEARAPASGRSGSTDQSGTGHPGDSSGAVEHAPGHADVDVAEDAEPTKVPWHFWLLVVALVLYLGWRLVQGVEWLLR